MCKSPPPLFWQRRSHCYVLSGRTQRDTKQKAQHVQIHPVFAYTAVSTSAYIVVAYAAASCRRTSRRF